MARRPAVYPSKPCADCQTPFFFKGGKQTRCLACQRRATTDRRRTRLPRSGPRATPTPPVRGPERRAIKRADFELYFEEMKAELERQCANEGSIYVVGVDPTFLNNRRSA
jgi:hypothetical protein